MSDNDHRGGGGDDDLTLPKATVQKLIAGAFLFKSMLCSSGASPCVALLAARVQQGRTG